MPFVHKELIGPLVWLAVGLAAGLYAKYYVPGEGTTLADIVVGVLGGSLSGAVFVALLRPKGFTGLDVYSALAAFVGAVVLLFIIRAVVSGERVASMERVSDGRRRSKFTYRMKWAVALAALLTLAVASPPLAGLGRAALDVLLYGGLFAVSGLIIGYIVGAADPDPSFDPGAHERVRED